MGLWDTVNVLTREKFLLGAGVSWTFLKGYKCFIVPKIIPHSLNCSLEGLPSTPLKQSALESVKLQ